MRTYTMVANHYARIDIAFGFDRAYVPHVASVVASIVRHAPNADFRFLMLNDGIDEEARVKLASVAPRAQMLWIEVCEDDIPKLHKRGHITRPTLFRLGLDRLAPADCTRLIYLDADLTVLRNISALWRVDLQGHPIAAAIDSFMDEEAFAERWSLLPAGGYFNAGVLVIDLAQVRARKLFARALQFQIKHAAALPYNDQDALNWVFWGEWTRLDNNWNIQRYMVVVEGSADLAADRALTDAPAGIVHFTCAEKPWLRDVWHPWSWIYWENLARTPFATEVACAQGVNLYRRLRLLLRWLCSGVPRRRRSPSISTRLSGVSNR